MIKITQVSGTKILAIRRLISELFQASLAM